MYVCVHIIAILRKLNELDLHNFCSDVLDRSVACSVVNFEIFTSIAKRKRVNICCEKISETNILRKKGFQVSQKSLFF